MSLNSSRVVRFAITALTCVYLAFAAQTALSYLLTSKNASTSSITIELIESAASAPTAQPILVLEALVVDGRAIRLETLDRTAGWEDVANGGNADFLAYRRAAPPIINFRGTRFVAILSNRDWSGVVRIKRNGIPVQVADVKPSKREPPLMSIEDPVAPSSALVFLAALTVFAGAAWWFGPIRKGKSNCPWIAFFVAFLHLLYWASHPVGINGDSPAYVQSVWYILNGVPAYYPPGYSALIGAIAVLTQAHLGTWLTFTQHAMVVLVAVWLYRILQMIVAEEVAYFGAILIGALSTSLAVPQAAISETATSFAMAGTVYFAIRSAQGGKPIFGWISGVLTGWAIILRIVPLVAAVPAVAAVYLFLGKKDQLRRSGITATAAALVVLATVFWFWHKSGRVALASSTGLHVFNRVVLDQKQLDENGTATRKLMGLLGGRDPRTFATHSDIRDHPGMRELSYVEAERLLREVSKEAIFKNPVRVVSYTMNLAWRMFIVPTDWIPPWSDTDPVSPPLENSPFLAFTAAGLGWRWGMDDANNVNWPVLCWVAIGGVFLGLLRPHRVIVLSLAWVVAAYMVSTSVGEMFCPRYNAAVVPFVAVLAMLPIDLLNRRWRI